MWSAHHRRIALVNITLQRRLLKKVALHKGLEDTQIPGLCNVQWSSFELYFEARPENGRMASQQVPVYHQTHLSQRPLKWPWRCSRLKGQHEILETGAAGLFFLMNFSDFVDSFTKLSLLSLHWEMFFGANTTEPNLRVLVKSLWDILYVLPPTGRYIL